MTVVDDETSRLWQLLTELSAQLSANREHCESLKRQCDALKTQAVHTGTGFTLRRFNTDITKEQFDSELERFNATLVLENQALQYENRQLSMLLKDYEGTLDNVMARFRSFAHSSQQFDLDSARHYEQLLLQHTGHVPSSYGSGQGTSTALVPPSSAPLLAATRAGGASAAGGGGSGQMMHPILQVQDPLALQWSLAHLSSLLRKALRSMQGEDDGSSEESSESSDEDSTSADDEDAAGGTASKDEVQYRPRSRAENPPASEQEQAKAKSQPSRASMSPTRSAARSRGEDPRQHKHDEGEGGYLRLLLDAGYDKSHAALERDIELERLRSENQALRELLAVASEPAVV